GRFYNLTSNERGSLRQDIESWFGRALSSTEIGNLDLTEALLGRTATIGIMQNMRQDGQPRAAITSVMLPPKGKPVTAQTLSDPIIFGLDGEFDRRAFEALPQWLQTIVARSPEYRRAAAGHHSGAPVKEQIDERLNGGSPSCPPHP